MTHKDIDLGFVEKCNDKYRLTSLVYPSKLGGKPAWLRWDQLLTEDQVKCENCSKIMQFLCQIYVPTELESKHYHKTIYIFCCSNGKCYSSKKICVRAFSSILGEDNEDLNDDELCEKSDSELSVLLNAKERLQKMCYVCSLSGDKTCSKCHSVNYCSKEHQVYDWKMNKHKDLCNKEFNIDSIENKFLFEEYEIVIEEEPAEDEKTKAKIYNLDESKIKDLLDDKEPLDKTLQKEFEKATSNNQDEYFDKFKKRINREPDQVIRYSLGGDPLWVSSEKIPTEEDIPNCHCGKKRRFEFQVLPQVLTYLGIETTIESIDWGTLCVYTCTQHCRDQSYREDFVWKQDFSQTNI